MISTHARRTASSVSLVAALLLAAPAAQANRYKIVDLGVGPEVTGVNSHGGISAHYYGIWAILYRGGKWHWLPREDEANGGGAFGINEFNEVAGYEQLYPINQPTLWGPGKKKYVLPMPPGGQSGQGTAISDTSLVAGNYRTSPEGQWRCFLWTPGFGSVDLGTLRKKQFCWPHGVNVFGQVVGYLVDDDSATSQAFMWEDGHMRDLGSLGGDNAFAQGINALGEVVGWSSTDIRSSHEHAFFWKDGVMVDIGTSADWGNSEAAAINIAGEIVGSGYLLADEQGFPRAVRFEHEEIIDLNDEVEHLGDWRLWHAWAINSKGHVVGLGTRGDGDYHAFMLLKQP